MRIMTGQVTLLLGGSSSCQMKGKSHVVWRISGHSVEKANTASRRGECA